MITINRNALPKGEYAEHVVNNGHKAGVLSGGELKGKARQYGRWYAGKRKEVEQAVYEHTSGRITVGRVLINSRWCNVWVSAKTGEPVQLGVK